MSKSKISSILFELSLEQQILVSGGKDNKEPTLSLLSVSIVGGGTIDHGVYTGRTVTGHVPVNDNLPVHPYVHANTNTGVNGGGLYITMDFPNF